MTKFIFACIILSSSIQSGFAQDTTYFNSKWEKTNKGQHTYFRIISHGKEPYEISDYSAFGSKQMKGFSLSHDSLVKDGYFEYYYPAGMISQALNYKNDLLDGKYDLYYPNDTLKESGSYKNNLLEGHVAMFFDNGHLKREAELTGGKYNGKMIYYNDKGIKIGEGNCRDDGWDGKWIKYNDNGEELTRLFYGNTINIEDCKIKLSSNKYVWELFDKEEHTRYNSYELKCISPLLKKKAIINNPPEINILISKSDDIFEGFYRGYSSKEDYVFVTPDNSLKPDSSYKLNYKKENGDTYYLLIFKFIKDDKYFVIEYLNTSSDEPVNQIMALDLVKGITGY